MKHHPREEDCDVSTKKWGSLATDVRDSEECILGCRQRFVSGVLAESGKPSTASLAVETTDELCEVLASSADHSGAERISAFYRLYCSNVDRIINECHSKGYTDLRDPGLPNTDFECPDSSVYQPGEKKACSASLRAAGLEDSSAPSPASAPPSTQPASSLHPSLTPSATGATFPEENLTASADGASPSSLGTKSGMGPGVKAAVAVASIAAFLAVLSFFVCLWRRRKRPLPSAPNEYRCSFRSRIKHGGESITTAPSSFTASPTSFISPPPPPKSSSSTTLGNGGPLSSPLRLKDRKLLPTFVNDAARKPPHGNRHRLARSPSDSFPTSPLCAPTTSKLEPRLERGLYSGSKPTPFHNHGTQGGIPISRSASTTGSVSGTTTTTASSSSTPVVVGGAIPPPPSSPTRPPRPHDTPLEIPGLVTPATSPRALQSPAVPPPALPRDIGVAVSSRDKGPSGQTISAESSSLYDLTEQCAREERESWGMFRTAGGGAPGVSVSASGKEGGLASPVLGEGELERMGGKYN
ncbi:hypothetical protein SAPIO_CDS4021 [Scedosporium apiospermum]|uniref:Uncharacterized protein n=1 Tax=Pseudallescheria apiosperma TaxID=563466 RepID=A0A084G943_PSEDA|nr:uncharacterized protein SAPIO_CDS4021 [Scedosporium apiospermum]KEZ43855.1 hypothetical protein SAPIO_CDS4021 [Scedosporium apiospermum]